MKHLCTRAILLALTILFSHAAFAGVAVLQPTKRIDANQPFVLTLLFGDDDNASQYPIPEEVKVSASADMMPPLQLALQRQSDAPDSITLRPGEYRKVSYSAILPAALRGSVRIEVIAYDASAVLLTLVRPNSALGPLPSIAQNDTTDATASSSITAGTGTPINAAPSAIDLINASRISLHEPTYFSVGNSGGDATAKFQLSFKYRLFQADDPRSRGLIDNLYMGYSQFSIWDLQAPSAPFRDTNYRPSLFYFLPDLGVRNRSVSRLSLATGLEHESNGRDGVQSRSINIAFVQPTIAFGALNDYHFSISPKLYTYLGAMSDNPDIAAYRGNLDLRLSFGKPDSLQFSTVLRKGRNSNAGSADSQLSYPLAHLIPGTAGYLMASYFYGYGESLLHYNVKPVPQFRIGFSLSR